MRNFTLFPFFKRDPRCVKSQKSTNLNSSDVQDMAIDCDGFQIGGLKNQVGYKKQKKK